MSEHVPHNLLTEKRPVRFIGLRADDARVLRPRANSTVLRHLRDPHVILAIIGAKHGATPEDVLRPRSIPRSLHRTAGVRKAFRSGGLPTDGGNHKSHSSSTHVERAVIVGSASPEKLIELDVLSGVGDHRGLVIPKHCRGEGRQKVNDQHRAVAAMQAFRHDASSCCWPRKEIVVLDVFGRTTPNT